MEALELLLFINLKVIKIYVRLKEEKKKSHIFKDQSKLVFEGLNLSGCRMTKSVCHLDFTVIMFHQPVLLVLRYCLVKVAW